MSPVTSSTERQASGRALGTQMQNDAWAWLAAAHPNEVPTAYLKVFAAVQLVLSSVPAEDEQMALAAIGSVLGSASVQRPDVDVEALVRCGFLGALDADRALRGPVQ